MAEILRELRVEVIVDTNKVTHMKTFEIRDFESLDELFKKAKEFTEEVLPRYE